MTLAVTLLGTGSPLPDPHRAGPSTLVTAGEEHFLVDAGRGVLMRLAAAGVGAAQLTALLITHLHSDHITDVGDVLTTRWITTLEPTPLTVVGPVGTREVIDRIVASLEPDIGYRVDHHDDLSYGFTPVRVVEVVDGPVDVDTMSAVTCAPTDHRPVHPTLAFRIDHAGTSVVLAGDTVPCAGLDRLAAGAAALVHTVIRTDLIEQAPIARLVDIADYHSSPAEAGATAARAGVGTLVLTHYVPAFAPGGGDDWRDLAATTFGGTIEVGDDLHRVEVRSTETAA